LGIGEDRGGAVYLIEREIIITTQNLTRLMEGREEHGRQKTSDISLTNTTSGKGFLTWGGLPRAEKEKEKNPLSNSGKGKNASFKGRS